MVLSHLRTAPAVIQQIAQRHPPHLLQARVQRIRRAAAVFQTLWYVGILRGRFHNECRVLSAAVP
eukprot:CAMPEP_0184393972 /NCGR_PEP_ID=MMETSP0007-20130409/37746_1 /TAXON_ID=97485 /ORGANISM="Prymnesium parvum, Strain Texoma1" /LENGTH=64 /DNA_ID=CAMNT_0026745299 /DNA_START=223 /DNA_END=413 /DNA_ORIENTATION=-